MGFLWLLFKMLVLMLLSALGGYLLRKWIERSYYKDVTTSYSKALGEHKATRQGLEEINARYLTLRDDIDSKLDNVIGRFSPIEDRLGRLDQTDKLAAVQQEVGTIQSLINGIPKPKEADLSPVLGAIENIHIPEAKTTNLSPVLEAIKNIRIPEAQTVDTKPILNAIEQIHIPEQKTVDLSAVLEAIEAIKVPAPEKPDLSPVLDAINNISIPEAEPVELSPVLDAIHSIRIPENKEVNTLPLMMAIRNIEIPEPIAPDLTPVLKAIENINIPKQEKPDLSPVLDAVRKIRIPEAKPTDLTPALTAIRKIKIPEQRPTDVKPVLDAVKKIRIPEAKTTDLTPVLKEIKALKLELAKNPKIQKEIVKTIVHSPTQSNQQVIANRLGESGNRLKKAAFGKPDDLKEISGVGPKLEKMLHGIGVYYFWQVADWKKSDVKEADDLLDAFKGRIERDEWVKQAKKLAKLPTSSKLPSM
ncbi:MAG: hypothetical protein KTR16_00665 [Acidiferrobacterales bacterium]|nr:hypothetical protein [Acidiferrobacterales bacterium]